MAEDAEKDGNVVPPRAGTCPICGRPAAPESKPFCSSRCADIDLGRWLKGIYRVPTAEAPAEDEEPSDET